MWVEKENIRGASFKEAILSNVSLIIMWTDSPVHINDEYSSILSEPVTDRIGHVVLDSSRV